MECYPSTVEAKVGFDVIRRQLCELMLGPLGESWLLRARAARSLEVVQAELERVGEMQQALRQGDALPLEDFLDIREILGRVAPEASFVEGQDLVAVRKVARAMRRIRSAFAKLGHARMRRLTTGLVVLQDLEEHIDGVVDQNGEVRDHASGELRRIRRLLRQKRAAVRARIREELRKAHDSGHAAELQPTMRNGRMVIPLRAEAKRKVNGFVHDVSATGQTVYMEPAACLELNNQVRILEGEEKREIERILREATAQVRAHLDTLHANLECLAHVDALQAKARYSNRIDAVMPRLNTDGYIDIQGGRNPVLLAHVGDRGKAVVPLDLHLGADAWTLVITGPNAGGKTVAMKTIGLFALMVAYGIPLPAQPESSMCLFERLLVEIGDEQSIEKDLSTFSSRIRGLQRMLALANGNALILIDEIGTGTDPAEGAALAQAALEHLTAASARSIVTTHHGALKAYAHEADGVENGSMAFDQQTLQPTYTFRQRLPGSSYAFRIAERMALDPAVLDRARDLLGSRATALEDLIASFEAANQAVEDRLREADRRLQILQQRTTRSESPGDATGAEAVRRRKHAPPRERPGAATRRASPDKKPLRVGDRVRVSGVSTSGEVVALDGPEVVIMFGSMRMRTDRSGVRRARTKTRHKTTLPAAAPDDVRKSIDLRGCRVPDVAQAVEGLIDKAVAANLHVVEILHGKGAGALREAVHAYLTEAESVVSFQTAPTNHGITIVKLS